MGATSLRRNERERNQTQQHAPARPAMISYEQHEQMLNEALSELKRMLSEARAAAPGGTSVVEDPRIADLTSVLWKGHALLTEAYEEIAGGTAANERLAKRVAELESLAVESVGTLASAAAENEAATKRVAEVEMQLAEVGASLAAKTAENEKLKADLAAFEALMAESKPAPGEVVARSADGGETWSKVDASAPAGDAKGGKGSKK